MTARNALPMQDLADVAACCRILGALLFRPPDHAECAPILELAGAGGLARRWPLGDPAIVRQAARRMQTGLSEPDAQNLAAEYQRLFVGPDPLAAPPWASVYLEEEGTLFGASTQALRTLLDGAGLALATGQHEPEDHIGLLCWAAAMLAGDGRRAALRALLAHHLLNWSADYFGRLSRATRQPFYSGLAALAAETLADIGRRLGVEAASPPHLMAAPMPGSATHSAAEAADAAAAAGLPRSVVS